MIKVVVQRILMIIFLCSPCSIALNKTEVFFSPDDQPTKKLIHLIAQARSKIYAAIYMITDSEIAQALIDAKKRGVDVKIIVDTSSISSSFGKGNLLKQSNVDVFVFSPHGKQNKSNHTKKSYFTPLMHNKFALIDNQLWTGSFNWTKLANKKNQENVIVTDNKTVYEKFEKHFHVLKKRCSHFGVAQTRKKIVPQEMVPENRFRWISYVKDQSVKLIHEVKKSIEYVMSH